MKVPMLQVAKASEVYYKISEQNLPLRLAYKLAKGFIQIEKDVEFYRSQYQKYLSEYIEKDEDGNYVQERNGFKIRAGKEEECREKIKALDEMEIEITDFQFTIEELDKLRLNLHEMRALMPFITEE